MVDPDHTPAELLAWTTFGPFQRAEHERLTRTGVSTRAADVLAARHPHRAA